MKKPEEPKKEKPVIHTAKELFGVPKAPTPPPKAEPKPKTPVEILAAKPMPEAPPPKPVGPAPVIAVVPNADGSVSEVRADGTLTPPPAPEAPPQPAPGAHDKHFTPVEEEEKPPEPEKVNVDEVIKQEGVKIVPPKPMPKKKIDLPADQVRKPKPIKEEDPVEAIAKEKKE